MPTNPGALAVPGGAAGPGVLDFAKAAGSGGKIYAARSAGRPVPEGILVDIAGRPTTDPEAHFTGGALLPMAGPRGTGRARIAALIGEAALGPAQAEGHWLAVVIDLARFQTGSGSSAAAEARRAETRTCPPAEGSAAVEIPGERERDKAVERRVAGIPIPPRTVEALRRTAACLGASDERPRPA